MNQVKPMTTDRMGLVLIELEDAAFGYGDRAVVHARRLDLNPGDRLGMFGPNGSGKTTLVRGVTGLLPPMSGQVRRQPDIRMTYLPQHRAIDHNWPMTGLNMASMNVSARSRLGWIGSNGRAVIRQRMAMLEVDDLARRSAADLSGGQQQRLMLAGALAADPQLLVLDEPTEGLDVRSRRILLGALRDAAAQGLCIIMISHAIEDLTVLCDEIAWLHAGTDSSQRNEVELVNAAILAERTKAVHGVV
jgi:ABC-type Mn2+/Zn2+ transport system ATPase subunit